MAELTAVAAGVEAGLGTHWRRRGGDGDPRWPAMKKTTVSAMERVPGHLARRGRCGRRGGASRLGRRARGGRWPRQRRAAAVMALGCARERAGGEDEGEGECERGRGSCVASPGHPDEEGRGQAGREGGGVARRSARALGTLPSPCRGRRRQRRGPVGWAGTGCCWAAQGGGPGKFLLFCLFSNILTYVLI